MAWNVAHIDSNATAKDPRIMRGGTALMVAEEYVRTSGVAQDHMKATGSVLVLVRHEHYGGRPTSLEGIVLVRVSQEQPTPPPLTSALVTA